MTPVKLFQTTALGLLLANLSNYSVHAYEFASGFESKYEIERLREFNETLPPENSSLGILWWNIERGASSRPLIAGSPSTDLEENLLNFALNSALKPDILCLGEFTPQSVSLEVTSMLERSFPYKKFFPYAGHLPDFGILVLSRQPIITANFKNLPWYPTDWDSSPQYLSNIGNYTAYWTKDDGHDFLARPYIHLTIEYAPGQWADLIPYHSAMPWVQMKKNEGLPKTILEIASGTNNPAYYQLLRLRREMSSDFEGSWDNKPLILIGDFNAPKYMGSVTLLYQTASENLNPVIQNKWDGSTFPAPDSSNAGNFPKMQLDHAFASSYWSQQNGIVIPLRGADHFPIYVNLAP